MNIKVLLIRPPIKVISHFSLPIECLGIGYLASYLRSKTRAKVELLDAQLLGWDVTQTVDYILESNPDVVGIAIVLQMLPPTVVHMFRLLRDRGYKGRVIIGGHSPTFYYEELLLKYKEVDAVVLSEAERSFCELISKCNEPSTWGNIKGVAFRQNGSVTYSFPERECNLDNLPFPARDNINLILKKRGLPAVCSSRGCPGNCSFCSVSNFYSKVSSKKKRVFKWIARSAENVVDELTELVKKHGAKEILFIDDEFFGNGQYGLERAIEIAQMIRSRNLKFKFGLSCRADRIRKGVLSEMKKAGLRHVFVGIEAGTLQDLKLYNKNIVLEDISRAIETIKSVGISFQAGFIMIHPLSDIQRLKSNIMFLKGIGESKWTNLYNELEPYFGARLTSLLEKKGLVKHELCSIKSVIKDPCLRFFLQAMRCSQKEFANFFSIISLLSSSVTYEWRRRVVGRKKEVSILLSQFEDCLNNTITSYAIDSLNELQKGEVDISQESLYIQRKLRELERMKSNLNQSLGLLMTSISACKDPKSIKLWSRNN